MAILSFWSFRKVLTVILCLGIQLQLIAQEHNHLVNPFTGTAKSASLTRWGGNGGTYPGAVVPSGSVQISPETRITGARGYDYTDSSIYFFSCIRHFSGFPEGSAGRVMIMPVKAGEAFSPGISHRPFVHQQETAEPGYYRMTFQDDQTVVEATTTLRTGLLRFTFPAGVKPQIFVGDAGQLTLSGQRILKGTLANTLISFSEDSEEHKPLGDGLLITFKSSASLQRTIVLKISTSTVDHAAAQNNIHIETGTLSFEAIRKQAAAQWARQLSVADITDPDEQQKTVFYTALYHSSLIPWVISDANGKYRGADGKVYHTTGKYEYGGFSPWDTFRSLHPLLTLLYPEKQNDVILSMLNIYRQTGHLPTESMTGNHAVPVITDAWFKRIRGYDKTLAYTAMKKNIMEAPFVQNDMEIYHQMGYVPFTRSESVTRTVEYAYNDWALGQYAKEVMHNTEDYRLLASRGLNYRNLFQPSGLFMLPRNGAVYKPEPGMTGYKEGNKWVYSYFVPHNGKDLVNLMGGDAAFAARLDSALSNDVILYDNETVLHLPYLFNAAGKPFLTQKWLRDIMLNRFAATPGGLPGNDDLGSMSSAYVFNAIGLFPVSPGRPLYAIGAPLFQSVKLHLAGQKTFTISASAQSHANKYVKSLLVNHHPWEKLVLAHEVLMKGGNMQFTMSGDSSQAWPRDRNPVELSETKAGSAIRVLNYSLPKTTFEPNELFWVRYQLQNTGSTGTRKVDLYVNGSPRSAKYSLVPEGATVTDSISFRLYEPGQSTISLSATDVTKVSIIEPRQPVAVPLVISDLKYGPMVAAGSTQEISYTLQNVTGRKQQFRFPVELNDQLLFTDKPDLAPGEQKSIRHTYHTDAAGLKVLKAGTLQQKYKVYADHLSSLMLDISLTQNGKDTLFPDHSGFENTAEMISTGGQKGTPGSPFHIDENHYVEIHNAPVLDQLGTTLTMMCWVYPEGNEKGLVDLFTKGDHHVLQTSNNETVSFFAGGWGRGDCTVKLPENWKKQWHHLAGVCNNDLLELYFDGILIGSSKVDGTVNLSADSKWQLGRNEEFPGERIFHGYMDQVRIYGQPLNAAEVKAIYNSQKDLLSRP